MFMTTSIAVNDNKFGIMAILRIEWFWWFAILFIVDITVIPKALVQYYYPNYLMFIYIV